MSCLNVHNAQKKGYIYPASLHAFSHALVKNMCLIAVHPIQAQVQTQAEYVVLCAKSVQITGYFVISVE